LVPGTGRGFGSALLQKHKRYAQGVDGFEESEELNDKIEV